MKTEISLPSFPVLGVKLSFFQDIFRELCDGEESLAELTTAEVCKSVVNPLTEHLSCSFCDYMLQAFPLYVAEANVFISHAWQYKFLDVVGALELHFGDSDGIVLWFDLFSNNQHKSNNLDFQWWSTIFKSAIARFGYTVMVFAPWHDPIPLSRGWCIYELYSTVETNNKFEICLNQFSEDILTKAEQMVNKMLAAVDCEKSQCFKIEDQERIFAAIRLSIGFHALNKLVFEKVRAWILDKYERETSRRRLEYGEDDLDTLASITGFAHLLYMQGIYDRAEILFVESLQKHRRLLGDWHSKTLSVVIGCADLYYMMGKYEQAEQLYYQCMDMRIEVSGPNHAETLIAVQGLAKIYYKQKQYEKAEPLFVNSLATCTALYGDNHIGTLNALNGLGRLYFVQDKLDEAEP